MIVSRRPRPGVVEIREENHEAEGNEIEKTEHGYPQRVTGPGAAELEKIDAAIVADPANAWAKDAGYRPVYAVGPAARIAVVGQAPGRKAQESGIAWDDASGVKLRTWLGVDTEEFYDPDRFAILPMDFFYPGRGGSGDLPPRADFASTWHPQIFAQLPEVRFTILVGAYAQKFYLAGRRRKTLTETVRAYRDYLPEFLPIVHPSPLNFRWQARNPWFEDEVVPELRRLVAAALRP